VNAFVRPPDIVVGVLMFPHGFFFLFYSPSRPKALISELAERNSTISGHTDEGKCNSKIHVRNLGYPFPLQIEGPKPPFWRFRNLSAILTAYIFGRKQDIHRSASVLQTTRSFLHRLKTTWSLVHKRLQIGG